jgi:hypothetical protein
VEGKDRLVIQVRFLEGMIHIARYVRIGLCPGLGSNSLPSEITQRCLYTKLHIVLLSEGGCNMTRLSYAHRRDVSPEETEDHFQTSVSKADNLTTILCRCHEI